MNAITAWLGTLSGQSHASEWINGITGTMGAILGSLVSIIWTAFYNRETRRRERREKFSVGAFGAYQRLNQIYSVSIKMRDHFLAGRNAAAQRGQPVCTTTMNMQRMSEAVIFTIDELWTLAQVSDMGLINRVNSLDHAFNMLLSATDRYGLTREEVWAKFPVPDEMDGIVGKIGLSDDQLRRLAPDIAALDHTLTQLYEIAISLVNDAFEAIKLLVYAHAKPLGRKFAVSLPDPSGKMVNLRAIDAPK